MQVTDAPPAFIDKQLGAIVGIEIALTKLIGKWKVSQNRPAKDRDGVLQHLSESTDAESVAMAPWMKDKGRHETVHRIFAQRLSRSIM